MRETARNTPLPDVFIDTGATPDNDGQCATTEHGATAMIRARFRMPLRDDLWVNELSTTFSAATFRLLTGVPKGDHALELGEVQADDPESVVAAITDHPDITAYEAVHLDDGRAVGQYEVADQGLYELLWASSLPPEFPVVVENGQMEFDLTTTREQFEAFCEALDETKQDYQLLSVVHTEDEDPILTERQRECMAVALRRGYFEVPRDCTLAEVAETLEIDKSSASETIRRGTARVLQQFLVGPD